RHRAAGAPGAAALATRPAICTRPRGAPAPTGAIAPAAGIAVEPRRGTGAELNGYPEAPATVNGAGPPAPWGPLMPVVEGSIRIAAAAEDLFALSQDYGLRCAWDPFVREMRFLDGATAASKTVRVWVRAWTGLTMTVRFVSFQPPRSVAMK